MGHRGRLEHLALHVLQEIHARSALDHRSQQIPAEAGIGVPLARRRQEWPVLELVQGMDHVAVVNPVDQVPLLVMRNP